MENNQQKSTENEGLYSPQNGQYCQQGQNEQPYQQQYVGQNSYSGQNQPQYNAQNVEQNQQYPRVGQLGQGQPPMYNNQASPPQNQYYSPNGQYYPPQSAPLNVVVQQSVVQQQAVATPYYGKAKSKWTALILCICLGYIGGHKFYEEKFGMGILYLCTFSFFGIGWLIDTISLLFKSDPYYV